MGVHNTVLQTVQMHRVYSAAYGILHYEEPLKSFEISVGHSPGFEVPSVTYSQDCVESEVKQNSLTYHVRSTIQLSRFVDPNYGKSIRLNQSGLNVMPIIHPFNSRLIQGILLS